MNPICIPIDASDFCNFQTAITMVTVPYDVRSIDNTFVKTVLTLKDEKLRASAIPWGRTEPQQLSERDNDRLQTEKYSGRHLIGCQIRYAMKASRPWSCRYLDDSDPSTLHA